MPVRRRRGGDADRRRDRGVTAPAVPG